MRRTTLVLSLLLASSGVYAQQIATENCEALPSLSMQSFALTPIAVELTAPLHRLGAPTGVLAQAYDELQSVDQVLSRQSIANCTTVASVTPPSSPAAVLPAVVPDAAVAPEVIDSVVYQPKTPYDNTPWRFDMSQNGKRMTADEFTAWMKARGVRVAKGASQPKVTAMTPAAVRSPHARPDPTKDNMAGQGDAASIGQIGGMNTSSLPLPPEPAGMEATSVHAAEPAPVDMVPATSVAPLQAQPEPSQSAPVGQPPGTLPSTSASPADSSEKDEVQQPPPSP